MRNNSTSIHVLGGMGPDASAKLYSRMISISREKFGVRKNQEYPDILLHSIPVPDFIEDLTQVEIAKNQIFEHMQLVKQRGGNVGIACNTAHLLIPDLTAYFPKTIFISMPVEVAQEVKKRRFKKVGILASPTTIVTGIYQQELAKLHLEFALPDFDDIDELGAIILEIVGGNLTMGKRLLKVADRLKKKGVDALILGCTELPLVFPEYYSLPILNSLDILANALLKAYYKERRSL
ncbi:MAG TPA: amino acid racemase [Candidatus Saccharimonadia bacterium]|nr:amino acid racemase [Candidatus Saccharimonadia bacterium]